MSDYIFEYRHTGRFDLSKSGKKINIVFWAVLIFIDLIFASFLFLYFRVSASFLPFVVIFGILSFFFVPYAILIRKQYYLAFTNDNKLIMKSAVNFILRKYRVELSGIRRIFLENPVKAQAILFENFEGSIIAKFNHLMMGTNRLKEYMELIKQRNPHIQIDLTEISQGGNKT